MEKLIKRQHENILNEERVPIGTVPIRIIDSVDAKVLYWDRAEMERFTMPKILLGNPGSGRVTYR